MKLERLERDGVVILELRGGLERVDDVLELFSACYEANTDRVLVEARALPPDFFALHTRFAGEVLQKCANYHVRLAGVFPDESAYSERFRELLREARRGAGFRAFASRAEAERWLASS
jgi:hypothetical protein